MPNQLSATGNRAHHHTRHRVHPPRWGRGGHSQSDHPHDLGWQRSSQWFSNGRHGWLMDDSWIIHGQLLLTRLRFSRCQNQNVCTRVTERIWAISFQPWKRTQLHHCAMAQSSTHPGVWGTAWPEVQAQTHQLVRDGASGRAAATRAVWSTDRRVHRQQFYRYISGGETNIYPYQLSHG